MQWITFLAAIFWFNVLFCQISADNCNEAGELCPNTWELVNNYNTTIVNCLSCQDDFDTCFVPLNSAWFTFTSSNGGSATLSIQNLSFDTNVANDNNSLNLAIFQAPVPCFSQSYQLVHCVTNITGNTNEILSGLLPNTTYHVVFSGSQIGPGALEPSEAQFLVRVLGPAVDRPTAQVSIGQDPPNICKGSPLTLIADLSSCPNNTEINWFKNGDFWLSTPANSITTNDFENGDIFYATTTCFDYCVVSLQTNSLPITVYDFFVSAGPDVIISAGQGLELAGATSENTYFWSPPLGLTNPNILNPVAAPSFTTTYYLTASNGLCEIVDEVTVEVISNLIIPNVFSPNGDGANDTWEILGTENYADVYILVYDRSGQKVLEAVNYNPLRFWNGSNGLKPLPTSTYFYVITLDRNSPNEKTIKGSVTIIR
jgi:gliding motility-associated-like protein